MTKIDPNTLEIDCNKWHRGKDNSRLLREDDKKMCCLGIDLLAQGVPTGMLLSQYSPQCIGSQVPEQRQWLLGESGFNSELAGTLMETNDDANIDDSTRKKKIKELYAKQGVTVTFINE